MLEITFGRIKHGWAETKFDFAHASFTVVISYESDPFRDLADMGERLMWEESPLKVHFTDKKVTVLSSGTVSNPASDAVNPFSKKTPKVL